MNQHKHAENAPLLTPSQTEVVEIGDVLKEFNFSLQGHGTPADDPESFFQHGIETDSNPSLSRYTLPLDATNSALADDWPHKRDPSKPTNVVLVAIPNPDPKRHAYLSSVDKYVFDEDVKRLDPRFILGFYDAAEQRVTLNPDFDLKADSYEQEISAVQQKQAKALAEIAAAGLLGQGAFSPEQAAATPKAVIAPPSASPEDDVW